MPNCNYTAFYVEEPFDQSNLGPFATHDFCYYQMLQMWKGKDSSFPFRDAHDSTYNVRDGSDWEGTLKPRLHERLRNSQNVILFLSPNTKNSKALHEEIRYAIEELGLPIIVVYSELKTQEEVIAANGKLTRSAVDLWNKLPYFKEHMDEVPTLHIPMNKDAIEKALKSKNFMVQSKIENGKYRQ